VKLQTILIYSVNYLGHESFPVGFWRHGSDLFVVIYFFVAVARRLSA